jgi:hypothetical protein
MATAVLPTSRYFVTQLLDSLSSGPDPSVDQATVVDDDANPLNNLPDATRKQLLSLQVLFPNEFVPALDLLDRRLVTKFMICGEEQLAALKTAEGKRNVIQEQDVRMQDAEEALQHEDTQMKRTNTADAHTHSDVTDNSKSPYQDKGNDATYQTTATTAQETSTTYNDMLYYVRSAQQRSSRFATSYDTTTSYQVRLQSWNCSCPAFAFAAFPPISSSPHSSPPQQQCPPYDSEKEDTNNTSKKQKKAKDQDQDDDGKWIFGGMSLEHGMPPVCKHLLACVLVEKCKGLFGEFVEEKSVGVEEAAGWAAGWGD